MDAADVPAPSVRATVRRVDFGSISLFAEDGTVVEATVPAKLRGEKKSLGNAIVVGDRVTFVRDRERAVVDAVEPRRNQFLRRAAGERGEPQVVAANLDQVVVVGALKRPEFRHGFVDRVLVQAFAAGLPVVLALNKVDLAEEAETREILGDYAPAGVTALAMCAITGRGVDALKEACAGRRSLFSGHSGVGKSTLLSRLAPGQELLAGEVNARTGKGRHTTTAALLLRPEPGLELIDTPGVRAFGLWGVDADTLEEYYPELRAHLGHCRFGDCRHEREPDCAVRAAVDRGEIHARRFASFLKLRAELEDERR